MEDASTPTFERASDSQLPLCLVGRGQEAALMEALGQCLRAHPNRAAGSLTHALHSGECRLQIEVEGVIRDPPRANPLRLPVGALVFAGTDRHLAPAPGQRQRRPRTVLRGHVGISASKGRSQQIDEASCRLLPSLLAPLLARRLTECYP